jgi:transcriptional regulator with XRE-family HTH domain
MAKKVKRARAATNRGVLEADIIMGERIKARRNRVGLTQDELGKALGVSFQQVQKYEKGTNRVSTGKLMQICQTLDCSIAELTDGMGGKDAKITPASTFAASREGVAIIEAMSKIDDIAIRRSIIQLAERLAA